MPSNARTVLLGSLLGCLLVPGEAPARPGDLVARYPLQGIAPQDIAFDGRLFYITSFLDNQILCYSADLMTLEKTLRSPFETWLGLTGIAYDSRDGTLWVAEPFSREIAEMDLEGSPTGRKVTPQFLDVAGPMSQAVPRGMAFDPGGDGGRGSFYICESVGCLIYEVSLGGDILRWITHPDDPDGYPGKGLSAMDTDVDVLRDLDGALQEILIVGGRSSTDWIRRLDPDGTYSGFSTSLLRAGGSVSGFLHQPFRTAGGRMIDPALIVLLDATAEVVVLEGGMGPIGEILDFRCAVQGTSVEISWGSGSIYDRLELYRDCVLRETFPLDPGSARDTVPGPGIHTYRIRAWLGPLSTESPECTIVTGGGRVLREEDFDGLGPVDLAVGSDGLIYISDLYDTVIHVHQGEDLKHQTLIELPFLGDEDQITGLAFNPADGGSLFIYNAETNRIHETDLVGAELRRIAVDLPNNPDDPRDKASVGGMIFEPGGGPGAEGLFWIVETQREMVCAVGMDGKVQQAFFHPVRQRNPVPPLSGIYNSMGGISELPGSDFTSLDLTAGSYRDQGALRILGVGTASGLEIPGRVLPLAGLDTISPSSYISIQHALGPGGTPILYAASLAGAFSKLAVLDPTPPAPRPLTDLDGRADGRSGAVVLSFQANDAYERIEVIRDCARLASIPEGSFSQGPVLFRDEGPPPGLHRYDVLGVGKGLETSPATVQVRTGPGALLDRRFAFPGPSPDQFTRDPIDGSYLASSSGSAQTRNLLRFLPDLTFASTLENLVPLEWEVATMAVRPLGPATGRIHLIARKGSPDLGGAQSFRMHILERNGTPAAESVELKPPAPRRGFMTYPTALCWSSSEGVFYYLERTAQVLVRMAEDGRTLSILPHPAPPFQSHVFNVGMAFDAGNGTILLTSSGPEDREINRILQVTAAGRLTGISIPLDPSLLGTVTGIALDGGDIIAIGRSAASELCRLQAFLPFSPPEGFSCRREGQRVEISWQPVAAGADGLALLRQGEEVALLPPSAVSYTDALPSDGRYTVYSLAVRSAAGDGRNAVCEAPPPSIGFIRGDADGSGDLSISDPIRTLVFLFLGGEPPVCADAADADDNGRMELTDAILVLGFLFLGGDALPPPFPGLGVDPTPDDLSCP